MKYMQKRYIHDCDRCDFLGQFNEFDLYLCPSGVGSVLARYSDAGPDYSSSEISIKIRASMYELAYGIFSGETHIAPRQGEPLVVAVARAFDQGKIQLPFNLIKS